jgi:hypothetical protein
MVKGFMQMQAANSPSGFSLLVKETMFLICFWPNLRFYSVEPGPEQFGPLNILDIYNTAAKLINQPSPA